MKPSQLLDRFNELTPGFSDHWESPENLFRDEDGSFTLHGVCAEWSLFFEKASERLNRSQMQKLFDFIERNVSGPDGPRTDLDNALCTCLLENIASTRSGEVAKEFMGPKSRWFFDQWHDWNL